jgi:tetratricopeptide (TPR) repeat protein
MKFRSSLALLVVAAVAAACYNDSDTNLTELRDNLDITYAIAGRFTIYPPEYYKRRIEIQTANLKKNPNDLNAYDNLAVAYDRIGKHDEAIATIRKERALLDYSRVNPLTEVKDELVPDAPPVNHRYTVEANEGTFLIHRWISNGGNPKNLTDAVEAEKHIAKAIEINPNAHFGREFAQLYCMRAILKGAKDGDWKRNFTENLIAIADQDKVDHKALRKGIAGMMVLGNAWNSPVMLKAIEKLVPDDREVVMFCQLRAREIEHQSEGPNYIDSLFDVQTPGKEVMDFEQDVEFLQEVRSNAVDFQNNRKKYVLTQLASGKHPDLTQGFWSALKDVPEIDKSRYKEGIPREQEMRSHLNGLYLWLTGLATGIAALVTSLVVFIKRRNARNT